ncbi:MAG: TolC family protein, partial [Gammaproteobacteria bacterium]
MAILLFMVSLPSVAQLAEVKELTLREAIMLALRYHPNVRNIEINRVVEKYSLDVAKNEFELRYALEGSVTSSPGSGTTSTATPSVKLKTGIGTTLDVSATPQQSTTGGYQQGAKFSVTQPLIRGFGRDITQANLMNAYDGERINKLRFKKQIMDTVTEVIQSYVALVAAENSLKSRELSLKSTIKKLDQEKLRAKAGRLALAELVTVEAEVTTQQVDIIAERTRVDDVRSALLRSIGLDPNTPLSISSEVRLPNEEVPALKKATDIILKNDINYQIDLINRAKNQRSLLTAKDNLRPHLDATLTERMGSGSATSSRAVGLQFSIPIDDKSLKQSLLVAEAALKKEAIDLKYKKWALESDIAKKLATLENQKKQLEMTILQRDLQKRRLAIAEKKLELGRTSTFETTTVRTAVINAEIAAIAAKNNYFTQLATLQQ